jgi:hypothetical protein
MIVQARQQRTTGAADHPFSPVGKCWPYLVDCRASHPDVPNDPPGTSVTVNRLRMASRTPHRPDGPQLEVP